MLSIYCFSCFKGIFLFHLRCLENPFLPGQYGVAARTRIILTAPHRQLERQIEINRGTTGCMVGGSCDFSVSPSKVLLS